MDFIKKNKILIIAIVLVVVIAGGAFAMFGIGKGSGSSENASEDTLEKSIKVIKSENIGLTLSKRADNKAIIMEVTKLEGISSIEYDVTYEAQVSADPNSEDGGESGITQRGVVGSPIPVKSGDSEIKRTIELGTCSKNVCKYDNVVSDIKFVIKVTYSNGEIGSVEQNIKI